MTNISGAKIIEGEGKKPQNAVVIADGMATYQYQDKKDDSSQKLFMLNGALVMNSGYLTPAAEIRDELKKSGVKGPKAISTSILDICIRKDYSPKIPLDFIVAGYEGGMVKMYYINATGFNPNDPGSSSSSGRFSSEQQYAFSGSGTPFALRVVNGQIDLGLDPSPTDITSGVLLMRDIAKAATESSGVNDRLQYGIVTPNGMHVLYHPAITHLDHLDEREYIKGLLGFEIKEIKGPVSEESLKALEYNNPSWVMERDFYYAFDSVILKLGNESKIFRAVCDKFRDEKTSLDLILKKKEDFTKAKKSADRAVEALLSRDSKVIANYLADDQTQKAEQYQKVTPK